MALSTADLGGILASIATLESSRRSSLSTFMGTKAKNGAPYTGAGIVAARALQQRLNNETPGPTATSAEMDLYRQAVRRVGELVAG